MDYGIFYRPFGSINYGFALPRNSPYTHNFSVAMLELQQEGFLGRMTEKWFRSRSVCGAETQAAQEADEEGGDQLHFSDMAGVFITLAVGVAAGMVVLLLELIYASYKDTRSRDAQVHGIMFFFNRLRHFTHSFWLLRVSFDFLKKFKRVVVMQISRCGTVGQYWNCPRIAQPAYTCTNLLRA